MLVRTVTASTIGLGGLGCCFGGRFQHLAAAGGVHGQHADPQLGGRADGRGYGVRDVVELQVEKDLTARGNQLADELRPLGGEELFSNFIGGSRFADGLDQLASLGGARNIERHDQPISCKHRLPV